jgi:tripartite-type tricarboxylate transporter receptor subunit TctC
MKLPRRQFLHLAAGAAALITLTNTPLAQDWPIRPVTMVYPFAAGSAADVLGRLFASRLSELLGQTVVFENVGGAGGMIGSNRVAKAAPDGYQFVLGGTFMVLNQALYKNPLYNATTDFAPVVLIVEQPVVLIARKDFPANDLSEFIAYARANQAKMQYGSGGVGSMPHLACELLNAAIGINTTHVPYRGGGPMMPDLIAGRIDYNCSLAALAIPQIESKTVKASRFSRRAACRSYRTWHRRMSRVSVISRSILGMPFSCPRARPCPSCRSSAKRSSQRPQLRPCRRS